MPKLSARLVFLQPGQLKIPLRFPRGKGVSLERLKASLHEHREVLCPLIVRKSGVGGYLVLDGHRRLQAIWQLQAEEPRLFQRIPCYILPAGDDPVQDFRLFLVLNDHSPLEPFDFDRAIATLEKNACSRGATHPPGVGVTTIFRDLILSLEGFGRIYMWPHKPSIFPMKLPFNNVTPPEPFLFRAYQDLIDELAIDERSREVPPTMDEYIRFGEVYPGVFDPKAPSPSVEAILQRYSGVTDRYVFSPASVRGGPLEYISEDSRGFRLRHEAVGLIEYFFNQVRTYLGDLGMEPLDIQRALKPAVNIGDPIALSPWFVGYERVTGWTTILRDGKMAVEFRSGKNRDLIPDFSRRIVRF